MKYIADRGGIDLTKRVFNKATGGTSGGTYTDVVKLTGSGWILFVGFKRNGGDGSLKFILDGAETQAALLALSRDTSGGYARWSTGIYNIPIRFEQACRVQCIYGSVDVIYALD